jgi:hypothetical protein
MKFIDQFIPRIQTSEQIFTTNIFQGNENISQLICLKFMIMEINFKLFPIIIHPRNAFHR